MLYYLIQSIIVYSLFAYLLYSISSKVSTSEAELAATSKWNYLPKTYWICVFIFMLIAGLRYKVGVDHFSYLHDYLDALDGSYKSRERGIEWGYLTIIKLYSFFHIHPTIYFASLAFLQIFFVVLAFKKNREVLPYILVVMVLGTYFISWMNGIRQMIVACSFLWASQFIVKRDIKHYLIWMAFAYLWHKSSVILILPFAFIYSRNAWDKKYLCLLIFFVCLCLGNNTYWTSNINQFAQVLEFIGYDHYAEKLDSLTEAENLRVLTFGPRMLIVLVTYIMLIINYPSVSKYYNSKRVDLYYKFAFIGMCGYFLFINTDILFLRPVQYFEIFTLPMTGFTLYYLKKAGRKLSFSFFFIVSISFLFFQCYTEYVIGDINAATSLYRFYPFID